MLLEQDSSTETKYEVFKRLNKYGIKLSDQEIRNVTGRLYGKTFPSDLKKISLAPSIREALSLKNSKEQKMDIEELILRFLAFNFGQDMYVHKIDEFLDSFMIYASEEKYQFDEDVKTRLINSFKFINKAIPDGGAFKYYKHGKFQGGFSTNIFDVVLTGVYNNLENLDSKSFKENLISLHESQELKKYVGAGSNTRNKIFGRVELGKKYFS